MRKPSARRILGTFVLAQVLFGACGTGGGGHADAGKKRRPDVGESSVDAGECACDEATLGEHYCIINPCGNAGNGTVVARQNPVPYQNCKE